MKTQAQVHTINGNYHNYNNPSKPNSICIPNVHPNGMTPYTADFQTVAAPPMAAMIRSVSTPTFPDHQNITTATRDLNATTPNQHLITTIPPTTQFKSDSVASTQNSPKRK